MSPGNEEGAEVPLGKLPDLLMQQGRLCRQSAKRGCDGVELNLPDLWHSVGVCEVLVNHVIGPEKT